MIIFIFLIGTRDIICRKLWCLTFLWGTLASTKPVMSGSRWNTTPEQPWSQDASCAVPLDSVQSGCWLQVELPPWALGANSYAEAWLFSHALHCLDGWVLSDLNMEEEGETLAAPSNVSPESARCSWWSSISNSWLWFLRGFWALSPSSFSVIEARLLFQSNLHTRINLDP